ncbi:MAG: cupin domain-containing protein [Notoacmeibacter sp.]|nr:cupin domain-containing protein [Notoacmeibacter sp.]
MPTRKIDAIKLLPFEDERLYGPPRHIHNKEDETFYILSGEIEFWMAGKTRMAGPGDTVFVPRGTEHTFRVAGNLPARMLTMMTPGGFEGFFAEMEKNGCRIPEDMEQVMEIGAHFNLTFTGPPLGVVI